MAVLSVPSYVIPGTYLENIRFLERAKAVRNIELLFFCFDSETESLLNHEIEEISSYRDKFSFSVHMPDPLTKNSRRLLELVSPFCSAFVLHPPEGPIAPFIDLVGTWSSDFKGLFLIENVPGRRFGEAVRTLEDTSICCDIGHLLLEDELPLRFLTEWGDRVKEIHFHGAAGGKDHMPVLGNEPWFTEIIPVLKSFNKVLHVELFDYKKIVPVIDLLTSTGIIKSREDESNY